MKKITPKNIVFVLILLIITSINFVSAAQNINNPSPSKCNGAGWNIGLPNLVNCTSSIYSQNPLESDSKATLITGNNNRLRPDVLTLNKFCQEYTGQSNSYAIYAAVHNYCNGCDQRLAWFENSIWNSKSVCAGTLNVQHVQCATGCTLNFICNSNSDCNDNNAKTEDICINPGSSNSSCLHNNIRCSLNSDCGISGFTGNSFCQGNGIFQNYNSFNCSNPGTGSSSCSNSFSAVLKSSCSSGQICNNAQCIVTQCSNGIDEDLDGLTDASDPGCWDNINDPNTYNQLLNNESRAGIACFTSPQCGRDGFIGDKFCRDGKVYQDYKTFSCSNSGLGSSSCFSNTSQKLVQNCTNLCYSGQCIQSACLTNSDCNDNDLYTVDECSNPGTSSSSCSHTKVNCVNDNDCGITGFFGVEFCSNNDVFKNFKNSKCLNPGTKQSYCQVNDTSTFLIDCGDNSCDSYGSNYCKNNNVYYSRLCNDKGCNSGSCFSNFRSEESLVQSCLNGCSNGQCKPVCSANSDCNDNNSNTEDICSNPGTGISSCIHRIIHCSSNSECGVDGFLNQKSCQNGNVFDKYAMFICSNPGTGISVCMNHTEDRQAINCTSGCQNGICLGGQCNIDSDCNKDFSSKYCVNNSVYETFHDYSCSASKICSENLSSKLIETCDYKCSKGACIEKTSGGSSNDANSDNDPETSRLIIYNDISDRNPIIESTIYSDGLNETVKKIGTSYSVSVNWSLYLWLIVIGFIILLIIILVALILLFRRR